MNFQIDEIATDATLATDIDVPTKFNCGNPECDKKLDRPTFCSEECRNKVYAPQTGKHRIRTLHEMKERLKEWAEEARVKKLAMTEEYNKAISGNYLT